jgi:hypothetical protein
VNRAANWNARGPPEPKMFDARLVGTPNPAPDEVRL